jgi:hypothetical protein
VSDILPRAFVTHRRIALTVWALMSVVNLAAAVFITSWPERQTDLDTIQRWGGNWLLRGDDIYATDWDYPDYPPHAIVLLSPLGAMSLESAVRVWSLINLVLVLVAPYLALRHVRPAVSAPEAALPVLMFLCWSGSRTLLQFTLLALTFGLASTVLADRRPVWSGLCLGLALIKPQVAAPFLVWAVLARRWNAVTAASGVIVVGFGLYCARAAANPIDVIGNYASILQYLYTGEAIMLGLAQLRLLFEMAASTSSAVDSLSLTAAVMLFGAICGVAWVERRLEDRSKLAAPSMVALWSLLTFYHLTYGFLILLPLAAHLILVENSGTRVFRRRLFWSLQLGLMFDVPGWSRRVVPLLSIPAWVDALLSHFDRVFMLALFAATAALALRTARIAGDRTTRARADAVLKVVT